MSLMPIIQGGISSGGGPAGQQVFTASGTFTVPADVLTVCVVCVGGGAGGGGSALGAASRGAGGGGELRYKNNISDTRALAGLGRRRQPAQTGQAVVVAAVLVQTQVPRKPLPAVVVLGYLVKDQAALVARVHLLAALADQVGPQVYRLLVQTREVMEAYSAVVLEHRKVVFQHPVALALPVGCV